MIRFTGFLPTSSHSLTEEMGLLRLMGVKHRAGGPGRSRGKDSVNERAMSTESAGAGPGDGGVWNAGPGEGGGAREPGEHAHRPHGHRQQKQQLRGQRPMHSKADRAPLPQQARSHGTGEDAWKSPGRASAQLR